METTYTNRVLSVIDALKAKKLVPSDRQFCLMVGLTTTQLSLARSGEREIPEKYISEICLQFPNVSKQFLETENGEMFLQNGEVNSDKSNNDASEIIDNQTGNKNNTDKGAPYYENISASAGLDYLIDNNDQRTTSFIKVPGIKVDGYINVFGDSMYPKYCSGEVIGVKRTEKGLVFFGHAYVIQMSDGEAYIKYIRKGKDEHHWVLESENEKYDPREFHLSKITKVFKIKAIIARVSL